MDYFLLIIRVSSSVSPTIPTILTTRRSLPLSASRRTKRMLSQKERVGTEGLAWWRALCCKEKNALIERAHRKEALGYAILPENNVGNTAKHFTALATLSGAWWE